MPFHLDTDFLVHALSVNGPERSRLAELTQSDEEIRMSAVAWYEFARGPRTAEQLAVAHSFFSAEGIIPFTEELADTAADVFRRCGSPRKRAADIAIGVTAASLGATLLTRNGRDFDGVPSLELESPSSSSGEGE